MGLYVSDAPPSPSLSITTVDPLTFDITVTPAPGVGIDQWWALYRSAADDIDVDDSEIIGIYFGNETFTVTQAFDGTQDHNGSYFYSATMLDRYWNESLLPGSVESGILESFPPVIVNTYPVDGDTIDVSALMSVRFSKTMNTESVESAISMVPDVGLDAFTWLEDGQRLIIYPLNDFEFESSYTLTISDAALDINGVAFDGNADGVAGGDYIINFHTLAVDEAGPQLLYSTPEIATGAEEFNVEAVVSFVFDEMLDPASVTTEAISFDQAGAEQEFEYLLTGRYNKSVLDIKMYEPLASLTDYSITLASSITDLLGNPLDEDISVSFTTFNEHYTEIDVIDNFTYANEWWDPEGSGSTTGTIGSTTYFAYASSIYLPGSSINASGKKSAYINYEWDTSAGSHLLREYIPNTSTQASVHFDNSYILQCYVYGDGSNNQFRFAIDEAVGETWNTTEVSTWYTLDWEGWRLLEWDLSDPTMVGGWIGNGVMDGTSYRMDSFQLTYDTEYGEATGRIFVDNLQVIKRMPGVAIDEDLDHLLPTEVTLNQNYPNPFNPETTLSFELPYAMDVRLAVYDLRGRQVQELITGQQNAGTHKLPFKAADLAAGVYLIRLETEMGSQVKRMLLLK